MKQKIKIFPAVMTVLSALYFLYVLSSEDTVLMADAVGGDPGGKLLPMIMAVFMFVGFLYITVKERPDGETMAGETRLLFSLTLGAAIFYVVLLRYIGFIILSAALVYGLEYYYTTVGEKRDKRAVTGGLLGIVITALSYIVMRIITRNLMSFGRSGILPSVFTSTTFEGCISLCYVTLLTVVLKFTVCKKLYNGGCRRIADAFLISFAVVLFLYVVFRQFFSVNLAAGILNI